MNDILRRLALLALAPCAWLAQAAPGDPDASLNFGGGGHYVTFELGRSGDALASIALQPDGKVVAVGNSRFAYGDALAMARYNPDGSLDATFGAGGIVRRPGQTLALRVLVQPDGRVVVLHLCGDNYNCLSRFLADGSPDPSFATTGFEQSQAIALQPDGKIVGVASNLGSSILRVLRANAAGGFDASFGAGGAVSTGELAAASAVHIQPDGKIVAIGGPSTLHIIVRRLFPDGTPDPSYSFTRFGPGTVMAATPVAGGKMLVAGCDAAAPMGRRPMVLRLNADATLDTTFGDGGVWQLPGTTQQCANGVAVRPDGALMVLTGTVYPYWDSAAPSSVVKLSADGVLDPTFATSIVLDGAPVSIVAMELMQDGKVVLGARARNDFFLMRIGADGSPDASFGPGGVRTTDIAGNRAGTIRGLRASGSYYVVLADLDDPVPAALGAAEVGLISVNGVTGQFDFGFGVSGAMWTSLSTAPSTTPGRDARALAVQPNGAILVGGIGSVDGQHGAAVMRLTSTGALDSSFAGGGRKSLRAADFQTSRVDALEVLAGGKILAAGRYSPSVLVPCCPGQNQTFIFVARLLPDGSLDPAFGTNGYVRSDSLDANQEPPVALAVQSDGKILVTGDSSKGYSALRLMPDGTIDSSFNGSGRIGFDVAGGNADAARNVVVQADGRVLLTGTANLPHSSACTDVRKSRAAFIRVGPGGTVTPATRGGGVLTTSLGAFATTLESATLDGDDRLVIAGRRRPAECSANQVVSVARFTSSGALDTRFGNNGVATLGSVSGPMTTARAIMVQADGKVVIAAENSEPGATFTLYRLLGGAPSAPEGIAGDTDGDGLPDSVEPSMQRDPMLRDNDVFGATRLFAMQQYRDFLGREGDAGGIAHWTSSLDSGAQTRASMAETFFNSAEFQGTGAPVARLYFAYFLRIPDYGGLQFWISQFRAGNSLESISNAFAGGPEFVNRYGTLTNAQFVSLVYQNVLGRAPDAPGLAYWTGQLDGGMTRGQMMAAFSESPEYRALIDSEIYVTMMYVGMLRREPDLGGFNFWVGYRDAGNSGLALINGFLAAPEYRNRFLP